MKSYFYEDHKQNTKGPSPAVRHPSSVIVVSRRRPSVVRRRPSSVVVRRPSSVVRRRRWGACGLFALLKVFSL